MTSLVVIDASAALLALTSSESAARSFRTRLPELECHVPHQFDAEVGNVLRRKELRGELDQESAHAALRASRHVADQRYPHVGPLAEMAWSLRGAVTFYDALYVALATTLDVPLLTADARLARAPGLSSTVELVA
ncbi:type II toxin-antitoxin system VapC family toxin [Actinopolyspora sp. H202]|uniref:type II toxin-antitoxin system VapC family toxin n=1 Tax=Actinopolyspora sp. H202 TaxID=1500456 RepID=UPI003EE4932D